MFKIERVNFDVAKKLNNITLEQFEELVKASTTKNGDDWDYKKEFTRLRNYTREIIKSNNNHKVNYGFVESKDFGRLQSKNTSLQRIFNGFRGILSHSITYDIDMSNAHPNIYIQLCKKHNISCEDIEYYINNRDQCLLSLSKDLKISKIEAKLIYLRSLNKEDQTTTYKKKVIKDKTYLEFDKQKCKIIKVLYEIYKKDFFEYVKNESYNIKGKLINLLLCKIENEYLNIALDYMKENNIEVCTLMYDGCMIYINDSYEINNVIENLNRIFKEKGITWTIKPHNNELLEILEKMKIKEIDSFIGANFIEVVDYILMNPLNDKIYRNNLEYIYIGEKQVYSNEKIIEGQLYTFISEQDYNIIKLINEENKIINLSKDHIKIKQLVESIMNKAPCNNKINKQIWEETRLKLYFDNGYYDFKEEKFIEGNYNKTFVKVNRNYNPKRNKEIKKEIYQKILYPIFSVEDLEEDKIRNQLLEFYLYRISRIMAGHIEDKSFLVLEGQRNCGKGLLSDLLSKSFEEYVKTTNIENFIDTNKSSDPAKALSWLVPYEHIRLAISQEAPTENEGLKKTKIKGSMIKKFCSGGDEIEARINNKDEKTFKLQSSLMICCNDLPEITPTDTKEFLEHFDILSKFIPEDFPEKKKLPGVKYYIKDDFIKNDFINRPEVMDEFVNIIIQAYKTKREYPKEIKEEYENNDEEDDYTKLFSLFTITENKNDYISNDDLRQIVSYTPFTLCKCKKLLKSKGAKEGYNNQRTKRGLIGLKRINTDED